MTSAKPDEEITKLTREVCRLVMLNDKHQSNELELISKNTKLVNERESLKNATARMDTEINNAHKDLVEIHDILSDGNSCDFEEDIAAALRITVKYSE